MNRRARASPGNRGRRDIERLVDEAEIRIEEELPEKADDDGGQDDRHEHRDPVEAEAERLLVEQPREQKPAAVLDDHQGNERLYVVRKRVPYHRRHGGAEQHFLEIRQPDELATRQPAPFIEGVGEGRQDRVDDEQRHEDDRRNDEKRHPTAMLQRSGLFGRDGHGLNLKKEAASECPPPRSFLLLERLVVGRDALVDFGCGLLRRLLPGNHLLHVGLQQHRTARLLVAETNKHQVRHGIVGELRHVLRQRDLRS